jgi:hypothetical protein
MYTSTKLHLLISPSVNLTTIRVHDHTSASSGTELMELVFGGLLRVHLRFERVIIIKSAVALLVEHLEH